MRPPVCRCGGRSAAVNALVFFKEFLRLRGGRFPAQNDAVCIIGLIIEHAFAVHDRFAEGFRDAEKFAFAGIRKEVAGDLAAGKLALINIDAHTELGRITSAVCGEKQNKSRQTDV